MESHKLPGFGKILFAIIIVLPFVFSCGDELGEVPDVYKDELAEGQPVLERHALRATEPIDISFFRTEEERQEMIEGRLIRGNVDFSDSTIQYYSVNQERANLLISQEFEEDGPLEIVDFGPVGQLPIENKRPNIYVMFNHPVVPLAKLGEVITESPIMNFDPPIEGVYRWFGTRTLSFIPSEDLIDEPKYEVIISADTQSLGGQALGEDREFEFFSEPIKMVNYYPGTDPDIYIGLSDIPTEIAQYMIVEFNQDIDIDHIRQFLTGRVGSRSAEFTIERPEFPERLESRTSRALLMRLNQEPPENTQIRLTLAEDASPKPDYPSRTEAQTISISTILPFRVRNLQSSSYDFPRNNQAFTYPIYLRFSHPLDENSSHEDFVIKRNDSIVVPVDSTVFYSSIRFSLENIEPNDRISVEVPTNIKDIHGRTLGQSQVLNYTVPEPYAYAAFPSGFRHLESQFPPQIVWEARNIIEGSSGVDSDPNYLDYKNAPRTSSEFDVRQFRPNQVNYILEDFGDQLNAQGHGTVFYNWRMKRKGSFSRERWAWVDSELAVQVTNLGISTRYAHNRLLVWVNTLDSGSAVANANVKVFDLHGTSYSLTTDNQGLAVLELESGEFVSAFGTRTYEDSWVHVRVEKDGDLAEFRLSDTHNTWSFNVSNKTSPAFVEDSHDRIFIFTDRGLYKPGEEIAIRGIHWVQDLDGFHPHNGSYNLFVYNDYTGDLIWQESQYNSDSGGMAHRFTLPDDLEPGSYQVLYESRGARSYNYFSIAEFRRLNFQVISTVPDRLFFSGDQVSVNIDASYLAGGPMSAADYRYYWTRRPVNYAPPQPKWQNYRFGTRRYSSDRTLSDGFGILSGNGTASISEQTQGQESEGQAYRYILETTVTDIDRQEISSRAQVIVHPASFYIASRFKSGSVDGWWSNFISSGEEVNLEGILVEPLGEELTFDVDGKVRIMKHSWKSVAQQGIYGRVNTRWEYVTEEISSEDVRFVGGALDYQFTVEDGGSYTVYVEGTDGNGRKAVTSIQFYATGSNWIRRASQTPSDINMIPDKSIYDVGETARILVQSPIPNGKYLLTIEREGIIEEQIIELEGSQELIEIPIKEEYLPVFYVALTSFTPRTEIEEDYFEPDIGRPRSLFGIAEIEVNTSPIELDVELIASEAVYGPGDRAEVLVKVTRNGEPVPYAEVTLLGVDRGVLDLINYHVPNPIDYFYNKYNFPLGVYGDDSRRLLLRPVTYDIDSLQGGDGLKLEERTDFNPLAVFEPFIQSDENGMAQVSFTLPDTLTTYRLTAIALNEARFGYSEDELLVQNPINVRTALPRKFRNRDSVAAGVVIQNLSSSDQELTVRVESDILKIQGENPKQITVPAGAIYELPFLLQAQDQGEGYIRFFTQGEIINEMLEKPVVVERPLVTEAFTTIGYIDAEGQGKAQEGIILPSNIGQDYGDLGVYVDSSMRPYIADSLFRLKEEYPWMSLSAHLYRAMALIVDEKSLSGSSVFEALRLRQFEDGGVGYDFPSSYYAAPSPYLSLLTADVMQQAQKYGVTIPSGPNYEHLMEYLLNVYIENKRYERTGFYNVWLVNVLARAGRVQERDLRFYRNAGDVLGIAGMNLLGDAYLSFGNTEQARELYDRSKNFMLIGTQTVDIKDTYEARQYFNTMETEMALMLHQATLLGEPFEIQQRYAGSLNMSRLNRRFHSRFDDYWIVRGFRPLLDQENEASTDYQTRLKIGEEQIWSAAFQGRSEGEQSQVFPLFSEPLISLERDQMQVLEFERDGTGEMYYTTILNYAIPNETALARDEGLGIFYQIESLDGTVIEGNDLELGQTYRARVHLSSPKRHSNLTLFVPVPSGAEIVDPQFVTSSRYQNSGGLNSESWTKETVYGDTATFVGEGYAYGDWDFNRWYFWAYTPRQTIYDNAISYFWEDFYSGSREISFLFRTTTPGVYPTPPVQASLEFEPEVFGRSSGRLFVIMP